MHTDAPNTRELAQRVAGSFVLLAGLLLVLGGIGRLLVFDDTVGRLEHDWVGWIADHRSGPLDTLAGVGSSLTDTWTVLGVVLGVSVSLWAAGRSQLAWLLPLGISLEFAAFLLVSTIIGRDRPDVTPLGSVPSTSSFPSGHVAAAVVVYGGLALIVSSLRNDARVDRVARSIAVVAVVFVGASRLYEGVHHPTDVVAGILLGAGALTAASFCAGLLPLAATDGPEPEPDVQRWTERAPT